MIQLLLATFGLTALGMAMSNSPAARKWSPVIGLFLAEPAWFYYAITARAWGIVPLAFAYSGVYAWGIYVQWFKKAPNA